MYDAPMRRTLLGLIAGLALGVSIPAVAASHRIGPDPHHCGALVNHVSAMLDKAHVAGQVVYDQPARAGLLLSRVDRAWPEFWRLAQECSPQH